VASGFLLIGVTALTGFLAPPWLLRWLGAERFGAYRALLDWTSYLALLEFGIGGALLGSLTPPLARGDATAVRNLLSMGVRAYLRVIPIMLLPGFGLAAAVPGIIHIRSVSVHELRFSTLILLIPILFSFLLVFRSLAEARQQNYFVNLLTSFQLILTTALWLVTARAGLGLPGQSLASAIGQILVLTILAWSGIRAYGLSSLGPWHRAAGGPSGNPIFDDFPDHKPFVSGADISQKALSRRTASELLHGLRWPTFIHSVTDRVGLISDNVIVAWILGASAVSPFYLTLQLPGAAQFLLRGLGNATWAGLVELEATEEKSKFQKTFLELTSTVSGLGLVLLAPIAAFNHHFVRLWVGPSGYAGNAVTVITCVNVWLWSIYGLWGWLLLGAGQIGRWVRYALAFTIVNLVISVVGTRTIGLVGPVLGTLAGFLLVTSWALPRVLSKVFQLSPARLWRTALKPWNWGVLYVAGLWVFAHMQPRLGWFALLTEMTLAGLAGMALWWMVSLDQQGRTEWADRFRKVLGYP
jgi:O-antigen/teichoic acid export membrane protein